MYFLFFILLEIKLKSTKLKWLTCKSHVTHGYVPRIYILIKHDKSNT